MTADAVLQRMQAMYDDLGALLNDARAAFRERDAAHEVALKKARADALEEAAQHFELNDYPVPRFGDAIARDLRALLEEAGK